MFPAFFTVLTLKIYKYLTLDFHVTVHRGENVWRNMSGGETFYEKCPTARLKTSCLPIVQFVKKTKLGPFNLIQLHRLVQAKIFKKVIQFPLLFCSTWPKLHYFD